MPEDIVKYSGNTKITYHIMSEEEKLQELARLREKALHDEASALSTARKEGREEGRDEMIEKMRKSGMTDEQIDKILSE